MDTIAPIFLSHGSPMMMIEGGSSATAWQALAAELPTPRAILAVSAHWMTRVPAVTAAPAPETIHDFYGFPRALYEIEYRPPGAVDLVGEIAALLPGLAVDGQRGLDHGAWVPLRYMYPAADIPVIQFGVLPGASPEDHYRLGQRLRPLTENGVLVFASGSATHNLQDMDRDAAEGEALPYVREFADWLADALARRDLPALFDYRRQAPGGARAHPTDEHLLPLYVALGAAGDGAHARAAHRNYANGALAMDDYVFEPRAVEASAVEK